MKNNKVAERSLKEEISKFFYCSERMFNVLKLSRGILFVVAIIPVVLTFIPAISSTSVFICSVVSFGLSLLNESLTSFLNEYKKKAIMEYQLFETGVTGSEFSKIEYDRETTNELNELAIRKGLPQIRGREKLYAPAVPDDMSDDYTYLYLCRKEAATTKYMLSRIFYIYFVFLILIVVCFVFAILFKNNTMEYLSLLITFYPIVSPIIKACGKCKECMKDCTKMCADIDNFFADGDTSLERLARMHYYVQHIEFEMLTNRPVVYSLFSKIFKRGIYDLEEGVTNRFRLAIEELKNKSLIQKGVLPAPKGKALITKDNYDVERLNKLAYNKKHKKSDKKSELPAPANGEPAKPEPAKPEPAKQETTKPAKAEVKPAAATSPSTNAKPATAKPATTNAKPAATNAKKPAPKPAPKATPKSAPKPAQKNSTKAPATVPAQKTAAKKTTAEPAQKTAANKPATTPKPIKK